MIDKVTTVALVGTLLLGAMELTIAARADDRWRHDNCGQQIANGMSIQIDGRRVPAALGGATLGRVSDNTISRGGCSDRSADAYYYNSAYAEAFDRPEYGRKYSWRNPYTGHYGYVTPMRENGACRQFKQFTFIGGQRDEIYGIACRQGDGSWRMRDA